MAPKEEKKQVKPILLLLISQSKLLNVLPAAGKQLLKCCACSAGGRREMNELRKGLAGARALVAMHRTTGKTTKQRHSHGTFHRLRSV